MPFYVFAWIGVIAYGLVIIIGKLASKYSISNPWLFNFSWTFLTLLFTIPVALANHPGIPSVWNTILIASLFNALWFICYAFATYKLDVSVFSPLYNFRTIFTILLSALLLGERLNPFQFFYFILIIMGGIFSCVDEKFNPKSFFNSAVLTAVSGMFFLSLSNVFTNKAFQGNGFWEGTVGILLFTQLILLITYPLFSKDLRKIKKKTLIPLIAMAVLAVIGNISLNLAYKINVGITALIAAVPASMIFVFLLAIFIPKLLEKHTFKVYAIRFSAAAVMIISALKLSM